jgi:hypothetical protein
MPSYKFIGTNESGFVNYGGKRFAKDEPVDVDDPALAAKLDGNGEFERVSGPSEGEAPTWAPPGPTGIGTGPGTGPYVTTSEVIDENASDPAPEPGPEEDAALPESTDEGPKRKSKAPKTDQA